MTNKSKKKVFIMNTKPDVVFIPPKPICDPFYQKALAKKMNAKSKKIKERFEECCGITCKCMRSDTHYIIGKKEIQQALKEEREKAELTGYGRASNLYAFGKIEKKARKAVLKEIEKEANEFNYPTGKTVPTVCIPKVIWEKYKKYDK